MGKKNLDSYGKLKRINVKKRPYSFFDLFQIPGVKHLEGWNFSTSTAKGYARFSFRGLIFEHQVVGEKYFICSMLSLFILFSPAIKYSAWGNKGEKK